MEIEYIHEPTDLQCGQAVLAMVVGMDVDEAIRRMEGIRCGGKPTSCPDQLARALKACRDGV